MASGIIVGECKFCDRQVFEDDYYFYSDNHEFAHIECVKKYDPVKLKTTAELVKECQELGIKL